MEENEVQKLRRDLNINPEMYIWKNITGTLVTDTQGSLYLLNGHRGMITSTILEIYMHSWIVCFSFVTFCDLYSTFLKYNTLIGHWHLSYEWRIINDEWGDLSTWPHWFSS